MCRLLFWLVFVLALHLYISQQDETAVDDMNDMNDTDNNNDIMKNGNNNNDNYHFTVSIQIYELFLCFFFCCFFC